VGKDLVANDASESRDRALGCSRKPDAKHERAVARQFASWVFNRPRRLPAEMGQLSEDQIRAQFEACYPFHPATLTVFQRKWQGVGTGSADTLDAGDAGHVDSVPTRKATARLAVNPR